MTLDPTRDGTLLPPNATLGERALESAMRSGIDLSAVGTLWNPLTCPAEVLPFLAWGLAITHWDPDWTEAEKRAAVLGAIPYHQRKGTRAVVEEVLARFSPLLTLTEWWQAIPPRAPHTFEVRAPAELGADFLNVETVTALVRDVAAVKPLRSHFDFVQELQAQATIWLAAGTLPGTYFREDFVPIHDETRDWSVILQTELGEPIRGEDGEYLEEV